MLYVVKARFRSGTEERRAALAGEFSQHIGQPLLRIRLLGALVDGAGRRHGILMLMEAESPDHVQNFIDQSPFAREKLYEDLAIDELQIEAGSLG
jgi:uncharacterized protein YciI